MMARCALLPPLAVLSLLPFLLLSLLPTAWVSAQTQVGLCYVTYSNVIDNTATAGAWASLTSITLTLNTSTAVGAAGFPSAALVTSVSGTRLTASADGLGRITSSVPVTLLSTTACQGYNGCDNLIYLAGAANLFDAQGLALQLAGVQTDTDQCVTSTITIKAGNISYCDGGVTAALYNTLAVYPNTNSFTCNPPTVVIPPYTCGIGSYNFSALASLPDIVGSFGGYTLYARLCGAVSQPDCVRQYGQNVQVSAQRDTRHPSLHSRSTAPQFSPSLFEDSRRVCCCYCCCGVSVLSMGRSRQCVRAGDQ